MTLSGSERRALLHLVRHGYVAPKNTKSVAVLLNAGLIKRDPALTLYNPEFEEVVRSSYHLSDIAVELEETEPSFWAKIRVPVGLLILGIIVFLFVTQKEFFESTMAIMTIAAGLIPLLAKLLATVQSPQK